MSGKYDANVQLIRFYILSFSGTKRFTNKATLWYVPFNVETNSVAAVPPMEYESPEIEERGRLAYERQKLERSKTTPSLMSPHPICDNQQQGESLVIVFSGGRRKECQWRVLYAHASLNTKYGHLVPISVDLKSSKEC